MLGGFEVHAEEGLPLRFSTRKAALLLAVLILAGPKGMRREVFAEILWPGRGEVQARSSLRQALVELRRCFPAREGAAVQIDGNQDTVVLTTLPGEVDIRLFDLRLRETGTADLAFAADLYRGDLLEGEALPDSLEAWILPHRTSYRQKALQLVERLSLSPSGPGSAEDLSCEQLASRLIAGDAASEEAHRALIRLHLRHGRSSAAKRQYVACREALMTELGVEPELATRKLLQDEAEPAQVAVTSDARPTPAAAPVSVQEIDTAWPPLPAKPSIVVLPFQNMSDDAGQDYFTDGVVEEITIALSRMDWLFVIARNSAFTYKSRNVEARQIGRELGVRYVLEGSVRKAAGRLRVAGQLSEAATGVTLWADRFDGAIEDMFELQDQIASSVIGSIAPKLEQAEMERARRKPSDSLDAYDHYLRGVASVYRWSRSGIDEALPHFYTAMELDRDFARASGAAAWCYFWRMANGWMADRKQETAEVVRLVDRVTQIGRDDAEAFALSGLALGYVAGDYPAGAAFADRALALNPNLVAGWSASGCLRACHDDPDIAIEHLSHARRLSPLDPLMFFNRSFTAFAHFLAGRYDKAWPLAESASYAQPHYMTGIRIAAASCALAGRADAARTHVDRALQLDPGLRLSNLDDRVGRIRPDYFSRYVEALRRAGLPE